MQSDGGGGPAEPILNMMRPVTRCMLQGTQEQDLQLRDALIIFSIRYQAPYVVLTRTLEEKLGTLICKVTKIPLGLPITTSSTRIALVLTMI